MTEVDKLIYEKTKEFVILSYQQPDLVTEVFEHLSAEAIEDIENWMPSVEQAELLFGEPSDP